jgi:hypothetical protein
MAFHTGKFLLVVKKLHAPRHISLVSQSIPAVIFEICRLACDWKLNALLKCEKQRENKKISVQDFQLAEESGDFDSHGQVSNP